jgi:hypothetical protein
VAPFFAALRKDFPSTLALHAFAEAVFFVTAAHMGLKRTFRQRSFSSIFAGWPVLAAESAHRMPLADASELRSVFDRRSTVKEAGLAATPWSVRKIQSPHTSAWRANQAVTRFKRVYPVSPDRGNQEGKVLWPHYLSQGQCSGDRTVPNSPWRCVPRAECKAFARLHCAQQNPVRPEPRRRP